MKPSLWIFTLLFLIQIGGAAAEDAPSVGLRSVLPELAECSQLILVTVRDWDSVSARYQCFERKPSAAEWREVVPAAEAVIGKGGLAWGIGLHGTHPSDGPIKREGDGRAPAGAFLLGTSFGYSSSEEARIARFPYLPLTADMEGVDDMTSRYYNRVVDATRIKDKDWKSSEAMLRGDDLYRWGVIIEQNWKPFQGFGSCIFLHVWQGPDIGTVGCTAMPLKEVEHIVRWLDKARKPMLIQLPMAEYLRLKGSWQLP